MSWRKGSWDEGWGGGRDRRKRQEQRGCAQGRGKGERRAQGARAHDIGRTPEGELASGQEQQQDGRRGRAQDKKGGNSRDWERRGTRGTGQETRRQRKRRQVWEQGREKKGGVKGEKRQQ